MTTLEKLKKDLKRAEQVCKHYGKNFNLTAFFKNSKTPYYSNLPSVLKKLGYELHPLYGWVSNDIVLNKTNSEYQKVMAEEILLICRKDTSKKHPEIEEFENIVQIVINERELLRRVRTEVKKLERLLNKPSIKLIDIPYKYYPKLNKIQIQ